jgi:N-acetylmuramoyl-L-alanine amidase
LRGLLSSFASGLRDLFSRKGVRFLPLLLQINGGLFFVAPARFAAYTALRVKIATSGDCGPGRDIRKVGDIMAFDTRELFARLIQCEAGGEGDIGMAAVASVIGNRARVPYGEFARVSQGGDFRRIIEQPGQFVCMRDVVGGEYNAQNVWNMDPEEIHYQIADWVMAGNTLSAVGESLFFYNPYSDQCPTYFPPGGIGVAYNRINNHCFYRPTEKYADT